MSENEIGSLIVTLGVLVCAVHTLGYIAEQLYQPRLVGEILAGILLGPFVLGNVSPSVFNFLFDNSVLGDGRTKVVLSFVSWLGVLLLMFISGNQVRHLLSSKNCRETAWIVGISGPLPFVVVFGLGLGSVLPLGPLIGTKGAEIATLLVLSCAVAVTSVPVISRIFHDLGILHTPFASLILGTAVLEDIALWAVLAVATALANQTSNAQQSVASSTAYDLTVTFLYTGAAMIVAPAILTRIRLASWNTLYRASRLAYSLIILSTFVGLAAYLGVNLIFAAFLAGFGLGGGMSGRDRPYFVEAIDSISKVAFALIIPLYFALVGHSLVFGREFSLSMFLMFFIGSSLIAMISVGIAAKLAGFRRLDVLNLAITRNARGGPGIVLGSVAYEAGIISSSFYTTLVLTAIVTSQAAGLWLQFVLNKRWPLLSSDLNDEPLSKSEIFKQHSLADSSFASNEEQ